MNQYWIIKMKRRMKIFVLFTEWEKVEQKRVNSMLVIVVIQSLSWVQLFVTPWTPVCQASLSFTNCQFVQTEVFWCRLCHSTIWSSVIPFYSYSQSLPASGSFPMSQLFTSGGQSMELQHQSFQWIFRLDFLQDWLVRSPCRPRDPQEDSPAPQFESISSSALNLLYGPTLTSVHGYWKNHSFDYTDLCWQSDCSAFYCDTAFLPKSKHLLISWLQSLSTVILESKKR